MIKRSVKRKKKSYRWLWLLLLLGGVIVCGVFVLTADKPPVQPLENARVVLAEAREADAEIYSRKLFGEAEMLYHAGVEARK